MPMPEESGTPADQMPATSDEAVPPGAQVSVTSEEQSSGSVAAEEAVGGQMLSSSSSNRRAVVASTKREIWAWYIYDFAANAFYGVAIPVFFPLLLTLLATQQAYIDQGLKGTPQCGVTHQAPCLTCVAGYGTMLNTTSGYTDYPSPKVQAGALWIDPVAYATIMTGLAVILQLFTFITLGPLADYGKGRKNIMISTTVIGGVFCILCLALVSPSLWWLGGIFLMLSSAAMGLALICFYSYLAILIDAHPQVLEAEAQQVSKEHIMETREKVGNAISLTGISAGGIGAVVVVGFCIGLTSATSNKSLQLRLAVGTIGAWFIICSILPFFWFKARPGPPFPKKGLSTFIGWTQTWATILKAKQYWNAFMFLVCFFVYSDGYHTIVQIGVLYAQTVLCMTNFQILLLVASVSLWAVLGCLAFYWLQRLLRINNKLMVVILLILMVPLPIWGLLGYISTSSIGLRSMGEMFAFAGWFGVTLGPVISYSRVLFIDMIPVGTESTFFSLFLLCDKGSSWLGPVIAAVIVQCTGQLRLTFWYVLGVMIVPLVMLIVIVDHKKGMVDAGRVKEVSEFEGIVEQTC